MASKVLVEELLQRALTTEEIVGLETGGIEGLLAVGTIIQGQRALRDLARVMRGEPEAKIPPALNHLSAQDIQRMRRPGFTEPLPPAIGQLGGGGGSGSVARFLVGLFMLEPNR